MKLLKKTNNAPAFSVTDITGKKHTQKGKILLMFFRYASCPFCNLRIHQLIAKQKEWKKQGLKLIAVFQSPKSKIKKYVGKQKAPFAIVADPKRNLYKKYKVEESSYWKSLKSIFKLHKFLHALLLGFLPGSQDGNVTLVPADFLIDKGKIKIAYYGKDISDHLPLEKIDSALLRK